MNHIVFTHNADVELEELLKNVNPAENVLQSVRNI